MPTSTPSTERPFHVHHYKIPETQGHFRPEARLVVTASLRTSGLLGRLSDAEARVLLAMLGCMTPNGVIQATALQITEALGCSQHHAAGILARLSAKTWQNYPVVVRVTREAAPSTYSLSHALLLHSERVEVQPDGPHTSDSEVVHYSRTRYALPRQAVEPMVLAQLGLSPDEASRSKLRELRRKLLALGVDPQTIDRLIATYPSSSIAQQLAWLPLR